MPNLPIVWPISGGYQLLEVPAGFNDNSYIDLVGASGDGSVILGYLSVDDSSCVRWDNGVLTTLTGPDVTSQIYPYAISQDGNTVVGVGNNSTNVVRWTTPTNGTSLPALPGDTATHGYWNQLMSDDGWIIVGTCTPSNTNTVWVNGVANSWGTFPQNMTLCSGDGLTIAGSGQPVGYWRSHVFYPLTCPSFSGRAVACNYDGTIIYGSTADVYGVAQWCYWDNLTSVTGSANFGSGSVSTYGTVHYLLAIGGADIDGTSRTGNTVVGQGSNYSQYAIKWDNGVFHNYQPNPIPPGGIANYGRAYACSGDGSIVVGQQLETDSGTWACYWDTDNVQHKLPGSSISGAYGSIAFGISRDGSMIYGVMFVDSSVSTARWSITGSPGAVGDVWSDPSFVDFSDDSIRSQFISQDNSWIPYGYFGETGGIAPTLFLAAKDTLDPNSILHGWGSYGRQTPWSLESSGDDPTTGQPYAALVFDDCATSTQWKITANYSEPIDGGIGDLWMDQRYVDFSDPAIRQRFIDTDKSWVSLGYYGDAPLNSIPQDGVIPVPTYPRVWNTVNTPNDPTDFIYGYGQGGTAPGWNVVTTGKNPVTDEPYPDMSFDDCVPPEPSKQPVVLIN